jgi:hypothetical protein
MAINMALNHGICTLRFGLFQLSASNVSHLFSHSGLDNTSSWLTYILH